MRANVTRAARPDAIDAERFADMLATPAFGLVRERVAAELDRARADCETAEGAALLRAQGSARALRAVLELPSRILDEMKQGASNGK